jgi:uncharacterized coiled-coil DUF342 family protein
MNVKEIKAQIREVRKLKLQCRAGTKERIDLGRKLKELKAQLNNVELPIPEIKEDIQDCKTVYYTGYLSNATKDRIRINYKLNFINKGV